jgi:hypothetical protein
MINDYQPTAAELRILRAEAAKVREQQLPRLTWTPPTVEAVEVVDVEDEQVAS